MTKGVSNYQSVLAVCVAFRSFSVLPRMAESLPDSVKISIVDNGPDDGIREWAIQSGHLLTIPEKNLGFGAACNLGSAIVDSEFILFINPDTKVSNSAISALLDAAEAYPNAVAFGPQISREDGTIFRYRPSRFSNLKDRQSLPPRSKVNIEVPSLNGACFLCRREAFDKIGGFDEQIFLYFEDDDLSLRLSESVGKLMYIPSANIEHASGGSSQRNLKVEYFKGFHYTKSYGYLMAKRKVPFAKLRLYLNVIRRLISIRMITSRAYRNFALGRLAGILYKKIELNFQD